MVGVGERISHSLDGFETLWLACPSLPHGKWRQMNEVRGGAGRWEIR